MAPRTKRRRGNTSVVQETPEVWTLPADLMLEIVARSEPRTLFRCAAASKLLRREILSSSFIRQVSYQTAPCILAYLSTYGYKPLTLIHPTTTVAASFCRDHIWRYMSDKATSLLDEYRFETSRRGLVLLLRRNIKNRPKSKRSSDMCVYDPMSGACTFLSRPPGIKVTNDTYNKYVLLTAADGIDCPFMLVVTEHYAYARSIKVQSASSCGTWGDVAYVKDNKFWWCFVKQYCNPAVLRGGVIHWLASHHHKQALSFDLRTGKTALVKLPTTKSNLEQLHLVTSSNGKQLKLVAIEGFKISVWLYLPVSATCGSGWSLHTVIDLEQKLRLLEPSITVGHDQSIEFNSSGNRTGDVVFLEVRTGCYSDALFVFDMETKKMHRQKREYSLLEIDLASRLQNMKIFP